MRYRRIVRSGGAPLVRVSTVALLLFASSGAADAAGPKNVVEKLAHGEVNWTQKTVKATGSGAPKLDAKNVAQARLAAERSAELDAYRNILEALKGVKITAAQMGAEPLGNGQIRAQVQGILKGCKREETRYYSDGGVDVVMSCSLDGGITAVLAPSKENRQVSSKGEQKYTGLIVDAVGFGAQPALAPRVLDDADKEVYVRDMVTPQAMRERGVAKYLTSVDDAKADPLVGKNPLVLKASGVGEVASDIKISADEAAKLTGQNLSFLAEGRVVIVAGGS